MRRRALFAADLEPLHLPPQLRSDLHLEYGRGDNPGHLSRLELEAGVVAQLTVPALISPLYPSGTTQ